MIGPHIPSEFHFPPAYRQNAFKAVREIIGGGVITREKGSCRKGNFLLFTRDFTTLPPEKCPGDLDDTGMRNSFAVNPDHYDLTWDSTGARVMISTPFPAFLSTHPQNIAWGGRSPLRLYQRTLIHLHPEANSQQRYVPSYERKEEREELFLVLRKIFFTCGLLWVMLVSIGVCGGGRMQLCHYQ